MKNEEVLPQNFSLKKDIRTEISIYQNLELYKTKLIGQEVNCLFKPDGTCVEP